MTLMIAQFRIWRSAAQQRLKFITRPATARTITMSKQHDAAAKVLSTGSPLPPLKEGVTRLYSMRFCPFAHRARLVLASKNIQYETINIHLVQKPEWFWEKNPDGTVPVVEKDGRVVYDSLIVAEYLDSVVKDPPLVAGDAFRKARDAILINYNGSKVVPHYYKIIDTKGDDKDAVTAFMKGLQTLEDNLAERGSKFFGGDRPGFIDYMIWPWQERLPVLKQYPQVDVSLEQFSCLKAWNTSMREDPTVKTCAQSDEMHTKFTTLWKGGDPNPYDVGLN